MLGTELVAGGRERRGGRTVYMQVCVTWAETIPKGECQSNEPIPRESRTPSPWPPLLIDLYICMYTCNLNCMYMYMYMCSDCNSYF